VRKNAKLVWSRDKEGEAGSERERWRRRPHKSDDARDHAPSNHQIPFHHTTTPTSRHATCHVVCSRNIACDDLSLTPDHTLTSLLTMHPFLSNPSNHLLFLLLSLLFFFIYSNFLFINH